MASAPSLPQVGALASVDLEQVHEDYADFVWRTLQRLGLRSMDLEDALQEVFIVVHRKLDTFAGSARMTTWLFGICLRVAAAQRRRAHSRREQAAVDLDDRADSHPSSNPEAATLQREASRQLEVALDALSLERRAVFVMFELEGLPTAAIAQMLGIPLGTVYSRLSAARADFQKAVVRFDRRDTGGGAR